MVRGIGNEVAITMLETPKLYLRKSYGDYGRKDYYYDYNGEVHRAICSKAINYFNIDYLPTAIQLHFSKEPVDIDNNSHCLKITFHPTAYATVEWDHEVLGKNNILYYWMEIFIKENNLFGTQYVELKEWDDDDENE